MLRVKCLSACQFKGPLILLTILAWGVHSVPAQQKHQNQRTASPSTNAKQEAIDNPLVGEWVIEELYLKGERKTEKTYNNGLVRFSANRFYPHCLGSDSVAYDFNPALQPAVIDVKRTRDGEVLRSRGIYKIIGNTLTLVLPDERLPRPRNFSKTPPESVEIEDPRWAYFVMKRKQRGDEPIVEKSRALELPPDKDPEEADGKPIQMTPAPALTRRSNARNPLISSPDDPKVDPQQIQRWVRQLDSTSQPDRLKALRSLAKAGPEAVAAVPRLLKCLDEQDSYEKVKAIHCFAALGPKGGEAVPKLHEILTDEERSHIIRFEAANALGRMGRAGEIAIPTLVAIVKDPGPSKKKYIRKTTAHEAMGLMTMITRRDKNGPYIDQRDMVLVQAIGCLGLYGEKARDAIPAIEKVRDDPNTLPVVRDIAKETASKLQP